MLECLKHDSAYKPHEVGAQLAALIYLRWADFQEAECEAIAAFDETDYKSVLPVSMHWRSWHVLPADQLRNFLSETLPSKLRGLGNDRHNSLATQLYRMADPIEQLGRFSLHSLLMLVDWLAEQPFETPADRRALLKVFDSILERTADKWINENRTPEAVLRLMTEIANPAQGDRIYDPCFGSAGLLSAACDHVQQNRSGFGRQAGAAISVSGVELNRDAFVVGLTRLALSGVEDPNIENGNSLERPATVNPRQEGFDLIVANPPFGGRISREGLEHFPIKTSDTAGLFIQHALSQLRPDGRAVIAVPHGILFRGGQEQRLREMLIKEHDVEAIVSLPAGTFAPYTSIPSSILVIGKKGPTERVRMVDAEEFIIPGKGRKPASVRSDLAKELARRVHASSPEKNCWDIDVATLEQTNWDLSPKRRDQSGLQGVVDSLREQVDVVRLKDCCLILRGGSVRSTDLTDDPSKSNGIPYIRIRDLQKGQVAKGSSWVHKRSKAQLDQQRKLRSGDVLLSKAGTTGKASIVRNGAVGGLVNSNIYILQPDMSMVDPHYLVGYLASTECRAWVSDKSRGAVIQYLSKKTIEDLPIPLPSLQVQQRVAENYRDHGIDVIAYLSQLILDEGNDPVVDWVDKVAKYLDKLPSGKSSDLAVLLDLGLWENGFEELRNTVVHNDSKNPLAPWVLAIAEVVDLHLDLGSVPAGPSLYSILLQLMQGLDKAISSIKGHLPNANRARELTKKIRLRIKLAISCLLDDVAVSVVSLKSDVVAGEMFTTDIEISNKGKLPLRDFSVESKPDVGSNSLRYFTEGSSAVFRINAETPREAKIYSVIIAWQAVAMDGQKVQGETELAFNVVAPSSEDKGFLELGASPYVCGDPITPEREDVFFGREDLLERIRRQISQTGNVVLLEGNRRSGKTSILKHLQGVDRIPGWFGVYWSFHDAEGSDKGVGVETVEIFRAMARALCTALVSLGDSITLPNGAECPAGRTLGIARACREGITKESPFTDFKEYTELILAVLAKKNLGLFLMLDEFDKLQQGINGGVTSPLVPENLRHLLQHLPRFTGILTGSRRLKSLREEYWSALYGLGTRIGVSSLSQDAAKQLIIEPVRGRLTYAQEATSVAIELTSAQPFLLQCLCNRVFDIAAQLKTRSVTVAMVQQAGSMLIEDNEHFASLWEYAGSDRRRYLLTLCHQCSADPATLRFGVLQEQLLEDGIEVSDGDLIKDLDFLRELELIELEPDSVGGHYRLAIALMGMWIEKQCDVEAVLVKARTEMEETNV